MLWVLSTAIVSWNFLTWCFEWYQWILLGPILTWEMDFFLKNSNPRPQLVELAWLVAFAHTTLTALFIGTSLVNRALTIILTCLI